VTRADRSCEVLVIGAGLSGLYAARSLARAGVDVVVVEGRRRVGGRLWTERSGFGADLDHGGQWLGAGQDRLGALVSELRIATYPTFGAGATVQWRQGRRHTFSGLVPTSEAPAISGAIEAVFEFDLAVHTFANEAASARSPVASLDQQTLGSWLTTAVPSPAARSLLENSFTAAFGVEPAELSHLFAVFALHAGGGLMNLLRTTGGVRDRRLVGGAQQLAELLAAELGDRVVLDAPVVSVSHGAERVSATCVRPVEETVIELLGPVDVPGPSTTAGRPWHISAKRAVVAVPPALVTRIAWDPPLPTWRQQAVQRVPMGAVSTVHCVYHRPFWRDEGLSGQLVSDEGAIRLAFDASPPDSSCGVLVGLVAGRACGDFDLPDLAARRRMVVDEITRSFGPRAADPLEVVVRSWSADPFSAGGPMGTMGPGVLTGHGAALRRPMATVHWAGAELATEWYGTMDGALSSGARAAAEVLRVFGRASAPDTAGVGSGDP